MYPGSSRRGAGRRGARRLGVDKRHRASAIPRRGGSKRAGRGRSGGAPLGDSYPGSSRRRGARRLGVDKRHRASAIPPHHGGSKRAGRGCSSGGAPLADSASASHAAHPRFRATAGRDGAKRRHPLGPDLPCRSHGQRGGRVAPMGERKGAPHQQDGHGDSPVGKIMTTPIPGLPEDILSHIHSLMPMREAARAACLSRPFLRSWRCHPNLIFNKDTIGVKKNGKGENFHHKIDRILRNHSGISLKTFVLDYSGMCGYDGTSYFDGWLQIALKPGIEELTLWLSGRTYNFPCSLLSDGVRNSLRYLKFCFCALRPTVEIGPLRSLASLHLFSVRITWDELECLLSNSLALEQLELFQCPEIICLKLPCALQRLKSLRIFDCFTLKVIESKAPNLSSLVLRINKLDLSLVETLQMKKLVVERIVCDALVKLPSTMPNLETLAIHSLGQVVDVPMLPSKFLYLKHLTIDLPPISQPFDYFSLVSFLDASPSLETFILDVSELHRMHQPIPVHPQLRHMPERRHGYLKSVKMGGFNSAKSLVELTCYILENAVSLECLTLDTLYTGNGYRCGQGKSTTTCPHMEDGFLMDALKALRGIRTYIENKVPSTVKLDVLEPCSRCHAAGIRRILSQLDSSTCI